MKAGALDRPCKIQRKTVTQDAFGEEIETWADHASVWAQRKDIRGDERWSAQQVNAKIDAVYRIRYQDGITPLDRFVDDTKVYDIHGVIEVGRREGLDLVVSTLDAY